MTITASERTFSRRTFVKGTGALIVAIGAPRLLNPKAAFAAVNGDFPIGPAAIDPNLIDSWIAIGTDNTVTMKVGKVELGQGTVTAAMQLVADELDVPLAGVKFVPPGASRRARRTGPPASGRPRPKRDSPC